MPPPPPSRPSRYRDIEYGEQIEQFERPRMKTIFRSRSGSMDTRGRSSSPIRSIEPRSFPFEEAHDSESLVFVRPRESHQDLSDYIRELEEERIALMKEEEEEEERILSMKTNMEGEVDMILSMKEEKEAEQHKRIEEAEERILLMKKKIEDKEERILLIRRRLRRNGRMRRRTIGKVISSISSLLILINLGLLY